MPGVRLCFMVISNLNVPIYYLIISTNASVIRGSRDILHTKVQRYIVLVFVGSALETIRLPFNRIKLSLYTNVFVIIEAIQKGFGPSSKRWDQDIDSKT